MPIKYCTRLARFKAPTNRFATIKVPDEYPLFLSDSFCGPSPANRGRRFFNFGLGPGLVPCGRGRSSYAWGSSYKACTYIQGPNLLCV